LKSFGITEIQYKEIVRNALTIAKQDYKELRRLDYTNPPSSTYFFERFRFHLTNLLKERKFNKKTISKEAIPEVLEIVSKEKVSVKEAIKETGLKSLTEEDLRKIIKKIFEKYPKLVKEKKVSALMGELMKEVRGKIDGKTVSKILNEELKK